MWWTKIVCSWFEWNTTTLFDHVLQMASEGKKNPPSAFSASKQASLPWLVPWIGCSRILIRGRLLTRLLSYVENLPTGNVQFRSTLKFSFRFLFWVSNCVLQLGLFAFDFKERKTSKWQPRKTHLIKEEILVIIPIAIRSLKTHLPMSLEIRRSNIDRNLVQQTHRLRQCLPRS